MRRRRDVVNVRSHRRGGRRRRLVIAPWIVISTVTALLLSGVSAGYAWLAYSGCSGAEVRVTVAASPTMAPIIDNLGRRWAATEPAVKGRCASIKVVSTNSAHAAQALGPDWNPRRDGPRPHVWVPDSTAWLKLASAREDAADMIPDRQPSLARTPAVIAMPKPMADAIGPEPDLSWRRFGVDLAGEQANSFWADNGHPEWGKFKIGMTNPMASTAGLHALVGIADKNDDGRITDEEREPLLRLSRSASVHAEDTPKLIGELSKLDSKGEKKVLQYLSAFPILEHDLWNYNESAPTTPLEAVYPTDGSTDADYPYLTLDAPWSTPARHNAAQQFLAFLRGPEGRQTFHDNAFRDPNRMPGKSLAGRNGTLRKVPTMPREVLTPESVSLTAGAWTASRQPMNVLFAMDVSDSMNQPVTGVDSTRIQLAGAAVSKAVTMFGDRARAGLWAYSSGAEHQELVPSGLLDEDLGGQSRRDALQASLSGMSGGGPDAPGAAGTALAAYQQLTDRHVKDASNVIVLITDGTDDQDDREVKDAVAKLQEARDAKRPTQLVTIGYGADVDMRALRALAEASGGRAYHAEHETDINSMVITALFNA